MYFRRSDPLRSAVDKTRSLIVVRIRADRGMIAQRRRESWCDASSRQHRNQRCTGQRESDPSRSMTLALQLSVRRYLTHPISKMIKPRYWLRNFRCNFRSKSASRPVALNQVLGPSLGLRRIQSVTVSERPARVPLRCPHLMNSATILSSFCVLLTLPGATELNLATGRFQHGLERLYESVPVPKLGFNAPNFHVAYLYE